MNPQDALVRFGLTRQEAVIYLRLCSHGPHNGYEMSKATGITRSHAYTALAALVDKGAADIREGSSVRYVAVPPSEFCDTLIREMEALRDDVVRSVSVRSSEQDPGYVTVQTLPRVTARIRRMLRDVRERVYIAVPDTVLSDVLPELRRLVRQGSKVVVLSASAPDLDGADVVRIGEAGDRIRVIVDSALVLTGRMEAEQTTCLYSGDRHLVDLFKEAMRNEIRLARNTTDAPAGEETADSENEKEPNS